MNLLHHHTRRSGLLLVLLLGATGALSAQAPRTVSYQGVLADPSGTFISDGGHALTLKLYDAPTGGSPVWSESQAVVTVRGLFNTMLGSATPIPTSLSFDRAYWLGVSVDGGAELSPRTALSATPYALYATTAGQAQSLAPGAAGVVTSVNGGEGALTITGGGGTTVNRSGSTITISSSGGTGGTGIQGVQSSDAALAVSNGSGPVATLALVDGGIGSSKLSANAVTAEKIADGAVTAGKVNSVGALAGDVLTFNGSNVTWRPASNSLTLPYTAAQGNGGGHLVRVLNSGVGSNTIGVQGAVGTLPALAIDPTGVVGSASNGNGVYGRSAAGGAGVYGDGASSAVGVLGSSSGSGDGVQGLSSGSGIAVRGINSGTSVGAGRFEITNSANTSNALVGTTNGIGAGVYASNTATSGVAKGIVAEAYSTSSGLLASGVTGVLAQIVPTSPGAYSAAVRGINNGTGSAGIGVVGLQNGSGWGVYGSTLSGFGVLGVTTGAGGGTGVYGKSHTGRAAQFEIVNTLNSSDVLAATTDGTGRAGVFTSTNITSTTPALAGVSVSTSGLGVGVYGQVPNTSTTGSNAGAGVKGSATGASTGNVNVGVWGEHYGGGPGVFGTSVNGPGVLAQAMPASGVGTSLEVRDGAIKVSGTNRAAFVHRATAANIAATGVTQSTLIDNPMCNNDPNAILIVTANFGSANIYNPHPIGVYYVGAANKWAIYNEDLVAMPANKEFNILVIKR